MFAAEGVPSLSRLVPAAAWVNAEPTPSAVNLLGRRVSCSAGTLSA